MRAFGSGRGTSGTCEAPDEDAVASPWTATAGSEDGGEEASPPVANDGIDARDLIAAKMRGSLK